MECWKPERKEFSQNCTRQSNVDWTWRSCGQEYEDRLKSIDAEARARLQEAVRNAQKVSSEIKEEARAEVKEMLGRARDEIERDRAQALVELRNEVVDMAVRASEKVLHETLDVEKHRKMIADFIKGLDEVDADSEHT